MKYKSDEKQKSFGIADSIRIHEATCRRQNKVSQEMNDFIFWGQENQYKPNFTQFFNWIGMCQVKKHFSNEKPYLELIYDSENSWISKLNYLPIWIESTGTAKALMKFFKCFGVFIRSEKGILYQYPIESKKNANRDEVMRILNKNFSKKENVFEGQWSDWDDTTRARFVERHKNYEAGLFKFLEPIYGITFEQFTELKTKLFAKN